MKKLTAIIILVCLMSCKEEKHLERRDISKVEIETLIQDSLLNVRALDINNYKEGIFATSDARMGIIFEEADWRKKNGEKVHAIVTDSVYLKYDSIVPNFRALSNSGKDVYLLSIGSPALLYKITPKDNVSIVYKETHEKTFYDSMDFWNDQEGIAIGDSTDGCLSVIITRDGGETWDKLSCDNLPKGTENEGAFAASDTNISIVGDNTWVATTAGRIYYSPDKGINWDVFDTPIVKDKETEGIYSIDFYDELNGFAIGGDYTKPDDNQANKILTKDGGKTWQLVAEGQEPGYRSCVQYIPNRAGKELVAIGFKGIDYSNDGGYNWKHLSDEGFYTVRFLNDSIAYAAGKGRISKLTFRK